MRKTLIFLMSIFSLTACNKMIDIVTESETKIDTSLPIEENASELPIISTEDNIDERVILEKAIKQQRDLYKLGFITHSLDHIKTDIVYYPLNDTFGYSAIYEIPSEQTSFTFEAGTSFDLSLYGSIADQLVLKQQINNQYIPLIYGKYNDKLDEDYYILGQDKDTTYMLQIGSEEEGYSEDIVQRIGESLRTEENGAFDPLYENFSINLDKITFPNFNEQRVAVQDINLTVDNMNDTSNIVVTYLLSYQDTITYRIETTEPNINKSYKKVDTITTSNGPEVSKFSSDNDSEEHVYKWNDDTYFYSLTLNLEDEHIIQANEIINIIESAQSDTRTFKDSQFFKPLSENENATKEDKQLINMLENINK